MSVCFASAGIVKSLSVAAFMLAWTHSVEKTEWQEDWRVTPQGLEIVEARVKGSGAGMEPSPDARLIDGWFRWKPQLAPLPEVALGNSGMAGEWRLCSDGACQTLSEILGQPVGTNVTTMRVCEAPTTSPTAKDVIQSEHVALFLSKARTRLDAGDAEGAREAAAEAVRLDPRSAEALEMRGDTLVAAKNYERALDDYDAAIRLTPNVAQLFSKRAAAFAGGRQPRLAARDYTEAVRLDRSVATLLDRAESFVKVRRYDLALDDLSEAIGLEPQSADLRDRRGRIYARNNAYDRAIDDYSEAIRLQSSVATYYLDRGTAYQLKGDTDRAIADYDKAITLDGRLALAYNNRGVVLRDKGNRPRALADFTTALSLDPDLTVAAEHRKALALEIERIGAQMPLKPKAAAK